METKQSRRALIKNLALGASALAITPASALASLEDKAEKKLKLKGNINHSVSRWTFGYLSLDDLCKAV
ncbi:MAG: hydroxypyruvate isomerase, partial [Ginsengibacter sp.]